MELVYDSELKRYVLKYVSIGGQRSIFDADYQEILNGEESKSHNEAKVLGLSTDSYMIEDKEASEPDNNDFYEAETSEG